MRRVSLLLLVCALLALMLISGCNLVRQDQLLLTQTPTVSNNARPSINILSPADGAEVNTGTQVLVSINATDPQGVTRVELLANNTRAKTVQSEASTGNPNFSAVLDYTPQEAGQVILQAVAYRGAVASQPDTITINVRAAQQQTRTSVPSTPVVGPVINPNDPTCRVLVNIGLNMRTGPGVNYPVVTVLAAGSVVPITGRTSANDWWQVRLNNLTAGWVSAQFTTVYGNCGGIPVVAAPPPPTLAAPTATFTTVPPTNTLTLTPPPPTVTPTPTPPDLLITSITVPETLAIGAATEVTANVSVTITNQGGAVAGQFTSTISVSPGGVETPLGVVANLGSGESIVLNVSLTFNTPGDYTLQARADTNSQITELSEVNNIGFATITITP